MCEEPGQEGKDKEVQVPPGSLLLLLVSWLVRAMPCLLNDSGVLKLRTMGVPVPGGPKPQPLRDPRLLPKPKNFGV